MRLAQRSTAALILVLLAASSLARVDVPLVFHPGKQYTVAATIRSEGSTQSTNFTISTSTGLTYLLKTNANVATAVQPFAESEKVLFLGEYEQATIAKETYTLLANNSAWSLSNHTVAFVNSSSPNMTLPAPCGTDACNIFGLGTNLVMPALAEAQNGTYQATFLDSLPGQYLASFPGVDNFTFGMALERPMILVSGSASNDTVQSNDQPGGMLHLLGTDETQYITDNVSWVSANPPSSLASTTSLTDSSVPGGDWTVVLDGWIFENEQNELKSKTSIIANADPLYSGIYLPLDQATLIHDAIPGAVQSNLSTIGTLSQGWTLPCNTTFKFDVLVGSQNFTLDQSTLVVDQNLGSNVCVSAIEAWTDPSETTYLLGSRFFYMIYVIFTVTRNGTQTVGFAPRSTLLEAPTTNANSRPSMVGPIVGGVLGGVCLILLAAIALYFILRRSPRPLLPAIVPTYNMKSLQHRRSDVTTDSKLPGIIEPFTLWEPSSVQTYNERSHQRPRSRSSSPVSVVFSHPAEPPKAPLSYGRHQSPDLEVADRIRRSRGNVSLASASGSATDSSHMPVSITTPSLSLATMATCG